MGQRHISHGTVKIAVVNGVHVSKGGIALPHSEKSTDALKYGIVQACGMFACHQTAVPQGRADELTDFYRQFPLPAGTLVEHTENFLPVPDGTERMIRMNALTEWWFPDEEWPRAFWGFKHEKRPVA